MYIMINYRRIPTSKENKIVLPQSGEIPALRYR